VSRRPKPPKVMVDGVESVVLTVVEYERLAGIRRQIGAQNARMQMLRREMKATQELLADLERIIEESPDCGHDDSGISADPPCLSCRLRAVIRSGVAGTG
jgi:hypothetical protein